MHHYTEHERADFRRFSKLLAWAAVLTFGLISLGSLVRASNSGLSCPDWPLCYGRAVPLFDTHIFLEWFHRVVAASLGLLVLVAVVKLVRSPLLRRPFGLQLGVGAVLLFVQVVLGGLTVLKLLDPSTVSAHLMNAMLFFTVLVWTTVRASGKTRRVVLCALLRSLTAQTASSTNLHDNGIGVCGTAKASILPVQRGYTTCQILLP